MHTDEYEISTSREITLCRGMIERLRKALLSREAHHGISTEACLRALAQDPAAQGNPDFQAWRKDHLELLSWQKRLADYEETLESLKGI